MAPYGPDRRHRNRIVAADATRDVILGLVPRTQPSTNAAAL
jgi:hypothetical protein